MKKKRFFHEFEQQFGQWKEHISDAIQMHRRLTMKTMVCGEIVVLVVEWKNFQRKLAFTLENFQGDFLTEALELVGYKAALEFINGTLVPVMIAK